MHLIGKIKIWLLFKSGIYEARRIKAIEHGDLVIEGVRYALSPCEWMNYTYLFLFERKQRIPDDSTDSAMQDFVADVESNCYYKNYYRSCLYMIFKGGKRTGYVISENRMSQNEYRGHSYYGYHIWWDIFSYKFPEPHRYNFGGIDNITEAATHMLTSANSLQGEKVELDLFRDEEKLEKNYKKSTKIMLIKMIGVMQECRSSSEGFSYRKSDEGYENERNPIIAKNIERYAKKYYPYEWLESADADGNEEALNSLAAKYYSSIGVSKDSGKAMKLWRKAADIRIRNPEAQFNLWRMYANGDGGAKDASEALLFLHLAAHQGHADAQFTLGRLYANGDGVVKDDARAVKFLTESAGQGNIPAQEFLKTFEY